MLVILTIIYKPSCLLINIKIIFANCIYNWTMFKTFCFTCKVIVRCLIHSRLSLLYLGSFLWEEVVKFMIESQSGAGVDVFERAPLCLLKKV